MASEVEGVSVETGGDLEAVVDDAQDQGVELRACWRELEEVTGGEEVEDGQEDLWVIVELAGGWMR